MEPKPESGTTNTNNKKRNKGKMKNLTTILGLTAGLAVGLTQANAVTIWDIDTFVPDFYVSPGTPKTDTFNITSGYNPATHIITSATAYFLLNDDLDFIRGRTTQIDLADSVKEWAVVDLGSTVAYFGPTEVNLGTVISGAVTGAALADLAADGVLGYKVWSKDGDFLLLAAKLEAEVERRRVPDGGATVGLLGFTLLGLVAIRRKLAPRSA